MKRSTLYWHAYRMAAFLHLSKLADRLLEDGYELHLMGE